MKRVLLSTDFSRNAQHAIEYALLLFGEDHMHYYLLNSYGMISNIPETLISLDDILHEQSKNALKRNLQQIINDHHHLEIETLSAYGEPPAVIKKTAQDHNIDIVVLGSRGGRALQETVFGSTTTNLVRRIKQPMLVVPLQFDMKLPKKMVFATDLTQVESLDSLEPMLYLAQKHQAEVIILNVTGHDQDQLVKQTLSRLDFNNHFNGIRYRFEVFESEDILDGISEFISLNQIDLLVLFPKQYQYFSGIFHRSITKRMIRRSDIPILVI